MEHPQLGAIVVRLNVAFRGTWTEEIRAAQEQAVLLDGRAMLLDVDGVALGVDGVHYDSAGLTEVGNALAGALSIP